VSAFSVAGNRQLLFQPTARRDRPLERKAKIGEPVCLWLPRKYIKPGNSEYVQGVEVPAYLLMTVTCSWGVQVIVASVRTGQRICCADREKGQHSERLLCNDVGVKRSFDPFDTGLLRTACSHNPQKHSQSAHFSAKNGFLLMFLAGPKIKNLHASKLASDFQPFDPGIM